jgi:hypothetical protein
MKTPFFPALRHCLAPMGSRAKSCARSLTPLTLFQIEERLSPALERQILQKPSSQDHSRERIFSLTRTFWCWIWQILQGNTSCREVVRHVQALFALHNQGDVDEGTSAYCQARRKLASSLLAKAFQCVYQRAEKLAPAIHLLQGRPLKVADGAGLRVSDTPENRKAFPPSRNQHGKPSFPIMKLVALFSAASGAILAHAIGSCLQSELRLLLTLRQFLLPKDILLADRHYGCFVLAAWLQEIKVDLIARLSRSHKVDFRKALKRLGPQEALFVWRKPGKASPLLNALDWAALPQEITVRIIRVRFQRPGFRTRELTVVTTLLDGELYPAAEILGGYLKRWRMEMCVDDLKTTLGMEMLSCRCPELLEKELLVFLIVHNFLRWMMAQAAKEGSVDLERISFKGTLDAFRQWTAALVQLRGSRIQAKRAVLWHKFLRTLVADLVPLRPGRQEPRAVKKLSKYPPLNQPRSRYVDRWSRNKRRRIARAKKNAPLK